MNKLTKYACILTTLAGAVAFCHARGVRVHAALNILVYDNELDNLARAIRFVMDNADTFGVSTEDYALLGYSSGGQLAGVFGNEEKGWGRYGVPKPGVLLLAYPINNFFEAKPAYHLLMDTDRLERRYYSYTVSKLVTPDYPPTFLLSLIHI